MKKLHKDKALQLVAPSDEIKTAYIRKSESFLASARLLLDNDRFEEPVSMAYYSMYYSVLALFFATGIKCENHTAAIILLDEVFGIDSSAIASAKTERIDKQYYVTSAPVRNEVVALIKAAESFDAGLLDVTAVDDWEDRGIPEEPEGPALTFLFNAVLPVSDIPLFFPV